MRLSRKKATHPSRTAERQISRMPVSGNTHSPSERNIITGVLNRNNHQLKARKDAFDQDTSLSVLQFCSMIFPPALRASEKLVQPPARTGSITSNSWSGVFVKSLVRMDVVV